MIGDSRNNSFILTDPALYCGKAIDTYPAPRGQLSFSLFQVELVPIHSVFPNFVRQHGNPSFGTRWWPDP